MHDRGAGGIGRHRVGIVVADDDQHQTPAASRAPPGLRSRTRRRRAIVSHEAIWRGSCPGAVQRVPAGTGVRWRTGADRRRDARPVAAERAGHEWMSCGGRVLRMSRPWPPPPRLFDGHSVFELFDQLFDELMFDLYHGVRQSRADLEQTFGKQAKVRLGWRSNISTNHAKKTWTGRLDRQERTSMVTRPENRPAPRCRCGRGIADSASACRARGYRASVRERGYPPSIREIGDEVGLASTSSVAHQLRTLERKGCSNAITIVRARSTSRIPTTRRPKPPWSTRGLPEPTFVPVLGRIAASGPILAEEAVEDVFPLPRELVGEGSLFMLRVVGESMIDAAICDGDWVVVRQQNVADNGDIVAAMIDGEATVKTFKRKDGHVWLMPHNVHFQPIPGDDAAILGKGRHRYTPRLTKAHRHEGPQTRRPPRHESNSPEHFPGEFDSSPQDLQQNCGRRRPRPPGLPLREPLRRLHGTGHWLSATAAHPPPRRRPVRSKAR